MFYLLEGSKSIVLIDMWRDSFNAQSDHELVQSVEMVPADAGCLQSVKLFNKLFK